MSTDLICTNCHQPANLTCAHCRLVLYCSRECQATHYPAHKAICRSPLIQISWKPTWQRENRTRRMDEPVKGEIAKRKYLWGNMPAIDVLQMKDNEGECYAGELRVLFAACGNVRSVVKTVAKLPSGYTGKLSLFVNDKCFDVVARNAIILLVAHTIEESEATDAIIHIWYSAFINQRHADVLSRIRPFIADAVQEVEGEDGDTIFIKTFTSGPRSLRLTLTAAEWRSLLSFCTLRSELSTEQPRKIRTAATLAPVALDNGESRMIFQGGPRRVCDTQFHKDGILLPFGYSRAEYTIPNPTFFQTDQWPLARDFASPLVGWPIADVMKINNGSASNDVYGTIFCHLRSVLHDFLRRMTGMDLEFELSYVDVKQLPERLKGFTFDRIDTSNIADKIYVGVPDTINTLRPVLKKASENKYATLLTLFMNAIGQLQAGGADLLTSQNFRHAGELLGVEPWEWPNDFQHPKILVVQSIAVSLGDFDYWFDKYQKHRDVGFANVSGDHGVVVKEANTIVERWPCRLKKRMGQPGAREAFDLYLASGTDGAERYVEWHRLQ